MSEPSSEPRFGAGTCLIAGICLLLAIPAPDAALVDLANPPRHDAATG